MDHGRVLEDPTSPRSGGRWIPVLLAVVVVAGLLLRLDGLGERMLSHPENFAPGLELPDWVRFPPPRHDLVSVLKGTLIDGHPPTYFVALLAWTKACGASLFSLRLPSALLGALSVLLVYRVALREGSRATALVAASLLALNGFHVYWSQTARMYVPVACLALLSTLLLLRLHERGGRGNLLGYLATTTLALWTQLYAWPFVFAQMVAAAGLAIRERRAPIALRAQVLSVVAALPIVQLSVFQNPPSRWHEAAAEFFAFGYLFDARASFFGEGPEPPVGAPWLIGIGALLLVLGALAVREPAHAPPPIASGPRPLRVLEWAVALGTTAALALFAVYTLSRPGVDPLPMWALVGLPLLAVRALPWLERRAAALAARPPAWLDRAALDLPLSLVLALLPVLCMLAVSSVRGAFVARGTVVFLPFLAIALAQGLGALLRLRWVGAAALAFVLALHLVSVRYFQAAQGSPRDYRGLAQRIEAELRPTDLVLVKNDFGYPPFIYYLRHASGQLVYADYSTAVAAAARARVWLVHFTNAEVSEEMLRAVESLEESRALEVHGGRALLFTPPR